MPELAVTEVNGKLDFYISDNGKRI